MFSNLANMLLSAYSSDAEAAEPYKELYYSNAPPHTPELTCELQYDEYLDCVLKELAHASAAIIIVGIVGFAGAASATPIGIIGAVVILIGLLVWVQNVRRTCSEEATYCWTHTYN